mmetsp:Transcript_25411/g.71340  ORF Transcript_25411/g.71340 Transcript_25411/m.71340 type:complete len:335 (+) Transcript_25411:3158-4162(+)
MREPRRREAPGKVRKGQRRAARVGSVHALGHGQHQDLRRVAGPGLGFGRCPPGARRARPREQARAHPARGVGKTAHRRRRLVLGRLPRPVHQPDEFVGSRRQTRGGGRRARRPELCQEARQGAGQGARHVRARGRDARLLERRGFLLRKCGLGHRERRLGVREPAPGAVRRPQGLRVQRRQAGHDDAVHGHVQGRPVDGGRHVPELGLERDLHQRRVALLRLRPDQGRRGPAQGRQEALVDDGRHHHCQCAGAVAVGDGAARRAHEAPEPEILRGYARVGLRGHARDHEAPAQHDGLERDGRRGRQLRLRGRERHVHQGRGHAEAVARDEPQRL